MSKLASSTTDTFAFYFHFLRVWLFFLQRPKEGFGSPGAGTEGGSVQLNVGGNQILGLWKGNKCTREPSLHLPDSYVEFPGLRFHPMINTVKTPESLEWKKCVESKASLEAILFTLLKYTCTDSTYPGGEVHSSSPV